MASIKWEPNVGEIVYGEVVEESIFSARAIYQDTDGDDYSPDGTYVYTYSGAASGTLTAGLKLGAGSYTLTATFDPEDAALGSSITGTASLTVEKATPVVVWNNPPSIKYTYDGSSGPKLSVEQLSATASVAGTFAYSPAIDTELSAGLQTVTATFIPANTVNYKSLPQGGDELKIEFEVLKGDIQIVWPIFENGVCQEIRKKDKSKEIIPYELDFPDAKAQSLGNDVSGNFSYSPARGSEICESQEITATFTPSHASNWNEAEVKFPFTVYKTISGPDIPPTMFGCYVQSVSASVGWGGTSSSCSLKLVEDPKNGYTWTPPDIGAACYFKYKGFEFGGVFVRWSYSDSTSGRYYDIVLESPAKLLDGVQVILDSFEGTEYNFDEGETYNRFRPSSVNPNVTTEVNNIYNVLGHFENHAFEFEGNKGIFGAAQTNSAGFLANKLLETIEILSCPDENPTAAFAHKSAFGSQEFFKIDLSEIKDIAPDFYRVQGVTQSINGVISDVTELVQNDYFVTLEPDPVVGKFLPPVGGEEGDDGGGLIENPNIKIKAISKGAQPSGGVIRSLVSDFKEREILISSSIGQELQDDTTQKLVLGGPGSRLVTRDIYFAYPLWGKKSDSTYIVDPQTTGLSYANGNIVPIWVDPFTYFSDYNATVFELRMAQNRQSWQTFKVFESVSNGTYDDPKKSPWCVGVDIDVNTLNALAAGNRGALSLASTSTKTGGKAFNTNFSNNFIAQAQEDTNKIYSAVKNVSSNFFGKKFVLPMPEEPGGPDNNIRYIVEDQKYETSWEAVDSAFDPGGANFRFNDVAMFDPSGRTKTYVEWHYSTERDFTSLGSNYAGYGGDMWTQNEDREGRVLDFQGNVDQRRGVASTGCGIDKSAIMFNFDGRFKPYVVMDAGTQVLEYDNMTTDDFGLTVLADYFFGIYIAPENYIGPGKPSTQIKIPPKIVPPRSFGIAQQSNRYVWGPWHGGNLKGKTEIITDDSLVPESFGSVAGMNEAGNTLADVGNAEMSASETGYVEIAEFPSYNIAERFAGSGPYVSDMSFTIDTGGFKTTYKFNTWTPQFGKLAKYNIDRIARINKASLELAQRERAKITKRPFLAPAGAGGAGQTPARLQANRTSGGFHLGQVFGNPHMEGTSCDLSDATALSAFSDEKYKNSAGCSVDQQWTGYKTRKNKSTYDSFNDRRMPVIPSASVSDEDDNNKGILPNSEDLDPYFSTAIYNDDVNDSRLTMNVDYMAAIVDVNDQKPQDIAFKKLQDQDFASLVTEVRSMNALKGPPILSGWGYDIAYNPVPGGGGADFNDLTLTGGRKYLPTGPLRPLWDAERGIWACGPEILCGTLATSITPASSPLQPSTFTVNVLRKVQGSGKGSGALEDRQEVITCYNRDTILSASAGENTWVMVIRVNYEWIPFWVSCA